MQVINEACMLYVIRQVVIEDRWSLKTGGH